MCPAAERLAKEQSQSNLRVRTHHPSLTPGPPLTDFLLLLVIWCIVEPDKANAELADVQQWTTTTFTWAYMLSQVRCSYSRELLPASCLRSQPPDLVYPHVQDLWAIFLVVVYFSKYGNMKLGKPDDKPEYNSATWCALSFPCQMNRDTALPMAWV